MGWAWEEAAWGCALIGIVMMLGLALAFWESPQKGFALTTHRPAELPYVMADRYMAFAMLLVFFFYYGDLYPLAAFFFVGSFMGLVDGYIYARRGLPHWHHTGAGLLSLAGCGTALVAAAVARSDAASK